ncbi:MAG: hypothetical protein H7259_07405 [Cytophagales bacterium]|nr:hypothetical protein [Cytophaga sp.]
MNPLNFVVKSPLSLLELNKEKQKDYRNIIILQMLIIMSAMLLKEILVIAGISIQTSNAIRDSIFLLLSALYLFELWDLLRNFTNNKRLLSITLIGLITAYGISIFAVNPLYEFFPDLNAKRPYLFIVHAIFFAIEATVIYFAIYDIFTGKKLSAEKIWGSACIYLMIGISFGSIFDLINIANPGSMGVPLKLGLESYTVCIYYSMTIIGGHDAFMEAIPLIQNVSIIEAVWSNLFVVLLVGRLLGKPDEEKE